MNEVILQGLMITLIGMGLVFVVIIFLWWLMGLLVRVTTPKAALEMQAEKGQEVPLAPVLADIEKQRRAAAAAVAVGLAMEQGHSHPLGFEPHVDTGTINPWQSVHRSWQLQPQQKRG